MQEKDNNQNGNNIADTADFTINTDENAAGTTHLNEPVESEDEVEKLNEELQQQKDKYLRLLADFENYKRRTSKERIELMQTAGKDIIVSLLDVLDDCDRAEKQLQTNDDIALQKEGIQLVFNKLRNILQSKGLKPMESLNTNFDVEKQEAVAEIPSPSKNLKNKVIDEVQKGYYLNDKIIRFAKVIVGK
ncbi:MAG: nucleotide exchange factor GrpE [Chitinophagaceae bacterium]